MNSIIERITQWIEDRRAMRQIKLIRAKLQAESDLEKYSDDKLVGLLEEADRLAGSDLNLKLRLLEEVQRYQDGSKKIKEELRRKLWEE